MVIRRTNIETKLKTLQQKAFSEIDIIAQVKALLKEDVALESRIENELKSTTGQSSNRFNIDLLETGHIYHIDAIKAICINYRLRFLDTKYFKGDIPKEAIFKIKALEKEHNTTLKGFKIIAPSKLFKLKKSDDPLLFAPIGNDYYYLIHKWGNDLHPLRKWLMLPFKTIENLALTTILASIVATLLVPDGLFSKETSTTEFWMLFFFMFKSIAAIVIFYGFALGKNFNTAIWNCKYNKA